MWCGHRDVLPSPLAIISTKQEALDGRTEVYTCYYLVAVAGITNMQCILHSLSLSHSKELLLLGRPKEQALDRKDLSSLRRDRVREGRGKERDKFLQSNHAPLFSSDPLERVRVRGRASYEIKPASLRISQGRLHCMCSVSSLKYSHLQCLCLSYKLLSAIKKSYLPDIMCALICYKMK